MTPIRTAARTLLGTLFIGSGVLALRHPAQLTSRAKPIADTMTPALEAAGLPTDPETLVKVNALVQVTGGILLASGYLRRPHSPRPWCPRRSPRTRSGPSTTLSAG
jgi:uncharacterized membrane protein YphA (DoxX/SURF4 family)